MNDWLKNNAWGIIIAVITLASTYAVYGYRIGNLEQELKEKSDQIGALSQGNVQTQIALVKIQVDIEYIKVQLNKIVK